MEARTTPISFATPISRDAPIRHGPRSSESIPSTCGKPTPQTGSHRRIGRKRRLRVGGSTELPSSQSLRVPTDPAFMPLLPVRAPGRDQATRTAAHPDGRPYMDEVRRSLRPVDLLQGNDREARRLTDRNGRCPDPPVVRPIPVRPPTPPRQAAATQARAGGSRPVHQASRLRRGSDC